MALNMIISYLLGYAFKDKIISAISAPIYYQLIVFISLTLPFLIKSTDKKVRLFILDKKIQKLKREMDDSKRESLDENTQKMYSTLVGSEVKTSEAIKSMHDELESLRS